MRRADRLFELVQLLRTRGVVTARTLAEELEVSERTVYRDVADLMKSGVPVDGEAGVGYRLRKGFDLPPLMFGREEVTALVLGVRMVSSWGDAELARSARSALHKIEAALPPEDREGIAKTPLYAPGFHLPEGLVDRVGLLRRCIDDRRKVHITYSDAEGSASERTIRPLGLLFWGHAWSIAAWCELRRDFRHFRLDRIGAVEPTPDPFDVVEGMTLDDFLQSQRKRA